MIRFRPLITLILCVALLAVRIGGAHLHLCFDGQEPPATVHLADAGDFDEPSAAGTTHKDANIDMGGDGAGKLSKLDLPLLALLLSVSLLLVDWRRVAPATRYVARLFPRASSRCPPPLRGPPLNSVV